MSAESMTEQLVGPIQPETPNFADVRNVVVLTSHGTWNVPTDRYQDIADRYFDGEGAGELSTYFTRDDGLYVLDSSDYAVGDIGRYLEALNPEIVSQPPLTGRMFVNANGKREVALQVRETTFHERVPIWKDPPSQEVQDQLVTEVWDTYLDRVQADVEMMVMAADPRVHNLIVDIHDTDTHVLNEKGEWELQPLDDDQNIFPLLLVSDRDGKAAHPLVREILGQQLLRSLVDHGVIDVERAKAEGLSENFIYKGGFTTERFGLDLPNGYLLRGDENLQERAQHLHFVQVELNRTMYLSEDRSHVDQGKMLRTQEAVAEALAETSRLISHLELGDWRSEPAPGTKEFFGAMGTPLLAATEWYEKDGVRKARPLQFS